MSRSRRKSPCSGITCSDSEKDDKRIWHRRYRHACKQAIAIEGVELEFLPHFRNLSDVWSMDKDGKVWWGFVHPDDTGWCLEWRRRCLRK